MRRVLVLLVATAFYASVKCEDSSGLEYEQLSADIAQLNIKLQYLEMNYELLQNTSQQLLEQSEQLTSTLQSQLESKKVDLAQLQRQVLKLSDENVKNAESIKNLNKTPIEEIGQFKSTQSTLQELVVAIGKNQKAFQQQLERSKEDISKLQNEGKCKAKEIKWVSWSVNQPLPENAVLAGNNWDDDAPTYVGRTRSNGIDHVCKVLPTRQEAFYSYLGREIPVRSCEVLTGSNFSWIRDSDGNVPAIALAIGKHRRGEAHYVGRAHIIAAHRASLVPGVVNGKDRALYLGFRGEEKRITTYEVLVHWDCVC